MKESKETKLETLIESTEASDVQTSKIKLEKIKSFVKSIRQDLSALESLVASIKLKLSQLSDGKASKNPVTLDDLPLLQRPA